MSKEQLPGDLSQITCPLTVWVVSYTWAGQRSGALRLLTRRSGVRFQLDHVLFILSVRHVIPSYCVWKRIYSVRNEGRPAAGNQRQARKWRRQVSSKWTKEAQRSTFNQSKKDVLEGDGQNAWLNIYICGWVWSRKNEGRWFGYISLIKWPSIEECGENIKTVAPPYITCL